MADVVEDAATPSVPTFEYAPFWPRFGAFVVDQTAIFFLVCLVGFFVLVPLYFVIEEPAPGSAADHGIDALLTLLAWIITWLWHATFESSKYQATPGKQALGLIVTDEAGARLSFRQASLRTLAKLPSSCCFYLGYFMMLFSAKRQALHDRLAGTLVLVRPGS